MLEFNIGPTRTSKPSDLFPRNSFQGSASGAYFFGFIRGTVDFPRKAQGIKYASVLGCSQECFYSGLDRRRESE